VTSGQWPGARWEDEEEGQVSLWMDQTRAEEVLLKGEACLPWGPLVVGGAVVVE